MESIASQHPLAEYSHAFNAFYNFPKVTIPESYELRPSIIVVEAGVVGDVEATFHSIWLDKYLSRKVLNLYTELKTVELLPRHEAAEYRDIQQE